MNQFLYYVSLFFKVATLKNAPQDLPHADTALYSGVFLALVVSLLRYFVLGGTIYPISRVVLEIAVPGLAFYGLLLFYQKPLRFGQAFGAMCGSGAIIYALALPILPSFYATVGTQDNGLSIYLIIVLDIWSIIVIAHIIKHTAEVGFPTAISISIALGLIVLLVVESIAPTGRPESRVDGGSLQESSLHRPWHQPLHGPISVRRLAGNTPSVEHKWHVI